MVPTTIPSGVERFFDEDDVIVSKTDLKGRITYANSVFIEISGYSENELIGASHNVIRHPEMPKCVFKLLWDRVQAGHEIFAYVVNLCKNGDHYWVLAHVTPTFDVAGRVIGYHSNRRVPERSAVEKARDLYARLLEVERSATDWRRGLAESTRRLNDVLRAQGVEYDEFAFSL